jgi:hypothetical protein
MSRSRLSTLDNLSSIDAETADDSAAKSAKILLFRTGLTPALDWGEAHPERARLAGVGASRS